MQLPLSKREAGELIRIARIRAGLTWQHLADHLDMPEVWTTAALLGQHPLSKHDAQSVAALLPLDSSREAVVEALQLQPHRGIDPAAAQDPTIYRLQEALMVYGPALKELIHENCGDGIMSAIDFNVSLERRDQGGEQRVVITFDGKFLDYRW